MFFASYYQYNDKDGYDNRKYNANENDPNNKLKIIATSRKVIIVTIMITRTSSSSSSSSPIIKITKMEKVKG